MKLKIDEIELDKELVQKIKKYGFTVEHVFHEVIERAMWKAINAYSRNRCKKCGKHLSITVPIHQRKAMRERGELCECNRADEE